MTREALAGSTKARLGLAQRLQVVPRVVSILNQRMGSPLSREDLEDAAQDAIATIWRRLGSYEGRSAFESWAYAFCQNVLSERRRSAQRRPKPVAPTEAPEPAAQDPSPVDFGPLYRALADLEPRSDAQLVRLKHFEGLTFHEIGTLLGVSPNTAKTRYYRVLRKLRQALGRLEVEIQP